MRERVCKNCGGRRYKVVGQNMVKCMFCGTLYVDEHASKEEEVLVVGAYDFLRETKFVEAVEEFNKILSLYPMSFEALYGKALAENRIVFYSSKKGTGRKKARFFGDEIPSILENENYKLAIKNSPPEVSKTYVEQANRIEKIRQSYTDLSQKKSYDLFVTSLDCDGEEDRAKIESVIASQKEKGFSVYTPNVQREKEEETFLALQTAKAYIIFANSFEKFYDGEFKNYIDRILYFCSLKKKSKNSIVLVLGAGITKKQLPKELATIKNIVSFDEVGLVQNLSVAIGKAVESTQKETAKIETVKIQKVDAPKKEYVDVESITPTELGHYQVPNAEMNETSKIKWIFLTLKHGDFQSASQLVEKELEKDPNNAELLFAQLLISKNIKTQEEFFANISNLKEREKIANILQYASKDFAQMFVDNCENLIISLDEVEFYNSYLLYFAKYKTPNREKFIEKAENKAIETLDDELINKVLRCFEKEDVDRFVNFYFLLAQKSDNKEYYDKVLSIDEGHEQSNIAMFLQRFTTDEDKLTFRDREEVEEVFKFLGEQTRVQIVTTVIHMVLPIAFYDLEKAEKQIDFYLSYISDEDALVELLKHISMSLQEKGFFKLAERYLSIALSKRNDQAQLYWLFIKIKAHCKSDNELIASSVKLTDFPEWETLLSLANEGEADKFAEIASKMSLYTGERMSFKEDLLDKTKLKEKLQEFLDRNDKILLEIEQQEKEKVVRGVNFYRLQLQPLQNYFEKIDATNEFEQFKDLIERIEKRLQDLDLTLDMSINVVNLLEKEEPLKNIYEDKQETAKEYEKKVKSIKNDAFLKKFLYVFLELFPMLFITMILIFTITMPKQTYLLFSQQFIVIAFLISLCIGMTNFIVYFITKKKSTKIWNFAKLALFAIGIINLILLCLGFYIVPKTVSIENAKEMHTLISNAPTANYQLSNDIDMKDFKWEAVDFSGNLNGNGFEIKNLEFKNSENLGLFKNNTGTIKNLNVSLTEKEYSQFISFGGITIENLGMIENCKINGKLTLNAQVALNIGGISAINEGGSVSACEASVEIVLQGEINDLSLGGVAGSVKIGKGGVVLTKNVAVLKVSSTEMQANQLNLGGIVGSLFFVEDEKYLMSQNSSQVDVDLSGNCEQYNVGGLVGVGKSDSQNNFAAGEINVQLVGSGSIGGLYGQYVNNVTYEIKHSYSRVNIENNDSAKIGSLVGLLNGKINSCFTTTNLEFYGEKTSVSDTPNCLNLIEQYYDQRLGFDSDIWQINLENYPTFK